MECKSYAIGIDIGGTNTIFGLVGPEGNIMTRDLIPTRGETVDDYLSQLAGALRRMIAESGAETAAIGGIGLGAPCANYNNGVIEDAANLPWPSPIPVGEMLGNMMQMPVSVSNDANAAAMGELIYGAARGMKDFILLTLGTGVGSGIVCGGRLLTGHRGFAGELGHCTVRDGEKRPCACGRTDCLQTYCSASGVAVTAQQKLARRISGINGRDNSNQLRLLGNIPLPLTARQVCEAADNGASWAREALEQTGEVLGKACADFATFSDPEAFILFGGVAGAFRHMEGAMRRAFDENALGIYRKHVRFLTSALPAADAAILGAAALARAD